MALSALGSQAMVSGVVAAASRGASLTAAAAHAKGTYVQQIAATPFDAAWIMVDLMRSTTVLDFLVDVAVGAPGAEQVVIPLLPWSSNVDTSAPMASFLLPLRIPAGSRIASRCQASTAGSSLDCQVTLFAPLFDGERGLARVEACGANPATSLGTAVDPGGAANTKGTPAQLIAATSFAYKWVCLSLTHTNALNAATSWAVDLLVGPSGQEVVVVPNLSVYLSTIADANPAIGLCFPLSIPAGTRVAVRAQSANTTATQRLIEAVLHGVG